jgi:hypothetical protein
MRHTTRSLLLGVGSLAALAACSDPQLAPVTSDDASLRSAPLLSMGRGLGLATAPGQVRADAVSNRSEPLNVDRGRFNIELRYLVPVTDRQRDVFDAAAKRWERIIIGDVPSVTGTIPSAFNGFPPIVSNGTIDDIVIEVALTSIDGPGNILGAAGPQFARLVDGLPLSGVMFFDVDDLGLLESFGLFEDVIVHEMGHVLGVGTLWNSFGRSLRQGTPMDRFFSGRFANVHWNAEGGVGLLPVENMGGPGTQDGHWRESVLRNELMTGFLNLGVNPLSRITAGSMRDLGYRSAVVGERFELPKGSLGIDPSVAGANGQLQGINIADREMLIGPVGFVPEK